MLIGSSDSFLNLLYGPIPSRCGREETESLNTVAGEWSKGIIQINWTIFALPELCVDTT